MLRPSEWTTATLAALALSTLAGCSVVLQGETKQCSVDGDCASLGFASATCSAGVCVEAAPSVDAGPDAPLDPKWGCVGQVTWAAPNVAEPLGVAGRFVKLLGETPLQNVSLKACVSLDVACGQPVATGTTDANGLVLMQLYKGFDGYAEIEPDTAYPDLFPSLLPYVPPPEEGIPLPDDPADLEPVHLVFRGDVAMIAAVLQTEENPDLGHILGLAIDCEGKPTEGVTLKTDTVSPETVGYYMNNGLPSKTTGQTATTGEAGFVNVPPGMITLTATSVDVGKTATITVPVRAGHITYVALPPSP